MSLHELSGSTIHLRLSIREGHGFGFLKSPIIVVAGTNGIFLETEVVPPSPDPLFHIDLVWETDKRNLRRFRASNTPVKLECFTVGAGNQRECIGSILLNIKSAQVIVGNSNQNVNEKWHRLIGVPPDAKALQPELLLSLTIQSPNSLSKPLSGGWDGKDATESIQSGRKSETPIVKDAPKLARPLSRPLVPECKQGYIQLGAENSCIDTFLIHICVKQLQGFELLNKKLVPPKSNDAAKPFHISFGVFGQKFKTKHFGGTNAENIFLINEEVVLPLRSSLSVLHQYLQENPCATLSVLFCGDEIAASELHIRSLVPINDVQSFSREFNGEALLSQKCILVNSRSGTVLLQDNHQPYIEVMTKLQLVSHLTSSEKTPALSNPKVTTDCSFQNSIVTGQLFEDTSSRSESRQSQDTFVVTKQSGPVWVPVAPGTAQSPPPAPKKLSEGAAATTCIKIVLSQLEFFQLPTSSCIRFLFDCPSSSAVFSKDLFIPNRKGQVVIDGITAEIIVQPVDIIQIHIFGVGADSATSQYIASTKVDISTSIFAEKGEIQVSSQLRGPPNEQNVGVVLATICLARPLEKEIGIEPKGNFGRLGPNILSSSPILTGINVNDSEGASKNPCDSDNVAAPTSNNPSGSKIMENTSGQTALSSLNLKAMLHEIVNQNTLEALKPPMERPPAPLDHTAAYKIVEELEDWKEKQQEIFLAELKRKEKEHISRITEEWTAQTKAQSLSIDNKMAECKTMIESLANAKQDLRDRLKTCAAREQVLTKAKEDLEMQYNLKFQEFTLAAKRLDEGFKLKVSLAESKCSKMEERIKELEAENESLHQQLKRKVLAHHTDGHMCGMSHNQVTQLLSQVDQLEGKLHASLQSKAYFKEQWGRAVREMNQAKLQFAQTSDSNKCFEKILGKEEKELHNDQRTLEMLRKEISQLNL